MLRNKAQHPKRRILIVVLVGVFFCILYLVIILSNSQGGSSPVAMPRFDVGSTISEPGQQAGVATDEPAEASSSTANQGELRPEEEPHQNQNLEAIRAELYLIEDYRPSFVHGYKGPEHQKYIVLHDTEGDALPQSVVDWWEGNGNLVAAHFVIGVDGTVVQCVPMDNIAHHAGFGNAGHNEYYGVTDESRDDRLGTVPIGSWAPDYGMNSYSIGIEMVHVGGSGYYPPAQLQALDKLIAYIDAYYGFESAIIDHKAWRTGNSDTSPEFAQYLANYQAYRSHTGA